MCILLLVACDKQPTSDAVSEQPDVHYLAECPPGYACYLDEHGNAVPDHIPGSLVIERDAGKVECIMMFKDVEVRFKADSHGVCHAPTITVQPPHDQEAG